MEPEKLARLSQALQDNGSVRDFELKIRRKDGTIDNGLFFGEVIDSQGKKNLLSVMIDISDRKRLEDQLLELNETLENRVAERSAELFGN